MNQRTLVIIILAIWAAIFAWSFMTFLTTEPTGDSFTRGLNRVTAFFGWQIAAGIVAIVSFVTASHLPKGSRLKWLARAPLALALLLVVFVIGVIAWANFSKPPADAYTPPDRPVTQPTAPAESS